jgi:hypothetical protein
MGKSYGYNSLKNVSEKHMMDAMTNDRPKRNRIRLLLSNQCIRSTDSEFKPQYEFLGSLGELEEPAKINQ